MKVISSDLPAHFVAWLTKHPMYLPSVSKVIDMGGGAMMHSDADLDQDPEDTAYCISDSVTGLSATFSTKALALEEIKACEHRLFELMVGRGVVDREDGSGSVPLELKDRD